MPVLQQGAGDDLVNGFERTSTGDGTGEVYVHYLVFDKLESSLEFGESADHFVNEAGG